MGLAVRLVRGPLDANGLISRLERVPGAGVLPGVVEENSHRILEMVISNEIASLEVEIALQLYHERVNRMDECLKEFRQSQEIP
ncbi:hypothetical protein D1007_19205 [Hordeum vulgare]|nr:hypothetical protein D1007_19205 [Hordeum vulgare]